MKGKGQFRMSLRSTFLGALLAVAGCLSASAETRLVMVEEVGCVWCARWNTEISGIYPKTGEGRAAPLMRLDIHAARSPRLEFASKLRFTPTFVLMVDDKEVSRLEGYPGEDFFWGILAQMLEHANIEVTPNE